MTLYFVKRVSHSVEEVRWTNTKRAMLEAATLQLLGAPTLRLADGSAVPLRQKAFELAALLYLDYRRRARRSIVAERLWEASTPKQASTNLRQAVLHTRRLEARHGFELFNTDDGLVELSHTIDIDPL